MRRRIAWLIAAHVIPLSAIVVASMVFMDPIWGLTQSLVMTVLAIVSLYDQLVEHVRSVVFCAEMSTMIEVRDLIKKLHEDHKPPVSEAQIRGEKTCRK